MGESAFTRRSIINSNGAIVKVNAVVGTTVTCTCGSTTKSKTAITDVVEFDLSYGTWTISAEIDGKTRSKTLVIDILKLYEITLKGSIFGIAIDMSEGDPEAAVTYTDDAVGFTPLRISNYGSWTDLIEEFFGCRPCLYDGRVVGYLNPDNYDQYEDGSDVDQADVGYINVMVEFKKLYYRYAVDGNILTFQVTDDESAVDNGYTCAAFKSMDGSGTVKDYMYYGAYEGSLYNEGDDEDDYFVIKSLGSSIATDISHQDSRTYCQNNGSSYGMEDWCKRCYILGLTMLVTKTRGIQDVLGEGSSNMISACTMDKCGLFYGGNSDVGVKVFGIENLWGNISTWCDGIMTKSSTTLGFKDCPPYNYTGSGYTSVADGFPRNSLLYPTSMISVMDGAAIVPSAGQSDSSLGWCDDPWHIPTDYSDKVGLAGQHGPFSMNLTYDKSSTRAYFGARIVAS